jgi:hypothetical protein
VRFLFPVLVCAFVVFATTATLAVALDDAEKGGRLLKILTRVAQLALHVFAGTAIALLMMLLPMLVR